MKKIVIAAAIILTAGLLTNVNKNIPTQSVKIAKISLSYQRSVLGTAD